MALHPTAEAYRQAMADGDHVRAASIMMDAHSGEYNSRVIDQIHEVGRMTQSQLKAPAELSAGTNQTAGIVNNIYVNGSGS